MKTLQDYKEYDKLAEIKILADIKQFGWHVSILEATENEPSFTFKIGI